jgi:hypothetical protein
MERRRAGAWFTLWVLFAINAMNFSDRQVPGAVGEAVRREWALSNGAKDTERLRRWMREPSAE